MGVREWVPHSLFEQGETDETTASKPVSRVPDATSEVTPEAAGADQRSRWIRASALGTVVLLSAALGYALHKPGNGPPVLGNQTETAATGNAAVPAGTGAASVQIVVDVHGDVRHPGVYRLPANSRVQDAVAAAGGYNHPEDAALVNAAAVLDDGAEVVIPSATQGTADAPADSARGEGAVVQVGGNKVDINTATEATLETLPGIGPSKAAAIVRFRTEHGPLHTANDLLQVPGIGPATVARLAPYLNFSSQR
jgi:competence protein ComEA